MKLFDKQGFEKKIFLYFTFKLAPSWETEVWREDKSFISGFFFPHKKNFYTNESQKKSPKTRIKYPIKQVVSLFKYCQFYFI